MDFFEDKLNKLESNTFDMKMQQYYSKMKITSRNGSSDDPEILSSLIEDHCVDTLALREANDSARRRITYLESEVVELRAQRHAESNVQNHLHRGVAPIVDSIMTGAPSNDLTHLNENRRRERQATMAVAEHDAVLIHRLQSELAVLQSRYDADMRLVKDRTERVTILLKEIKDKDLKISTLEMDQQKSAAHVKSLTAQLISTQQLLETERKSVKAILESQSNSNKIDGNANRRQGDKRTDSRPSSANTVMETISYSSREDLSTMRRQGGGKLDMRSSTQISFLGNDGRPRVAEQQSSTRTTSSSNSTNGELLQPQPIRRSGSYTNGSAPFETVEPVNERNLRAQNAKLLQMLERERELLRGQEAVLNQVRDSAVEITLLEAEEIARLECDLNKCHNEKDSWRKKCKAAEFQAGQLSHQLLQLEVLINQSGFIYQPSNTVTASNKNGISKSPPIHVLGNDQDATICVDIGCGISAYQPTEMCRDGQSDVSYTSADKISRDRKQPSIFGAVDSHQEFLSSDKQCKLGH